MTVKTLFFIFFILTQQQIYASNKFRGASQSVGCVLNFFGATNSVLSLAALIHIAIQISVKEALIMFAALFISVIVIDIVTNIINAPATLLALIGIPFNIFVIIYYIINFNDWETFL